MPSIIQNLNSILSTKSELSYIIQENGYDPGDVFSEYPSYIRSIIASGSGGGEVTYAYLDQKLEDYPTYAAISNMGYLTSVPNDYPTYTAISEMSYVTSTALENASYVTESYTYTYYAQKSAVNAMFSYDSATGILTITTI